MKKIILSIVAVAILSINSFGQAPEGFKYQAVVRNASNTILINQAVGLRMTIKQGSIVGTTVYSESFASTTSANGLVNVEIGNGTPISGTFANIDWANGPFFIETAIDATGGSNYIVMGTSQLMSVPYALYAKTSGSSTPGPIGPQGNQGPAGATGPQGPAGATGASATSLWIGVDFGPSSEVGNPTPTNWTSSNGSSSLTNLVDHAGNPTTVGLNFSTTPSSFEATVLSTAVPLTSVDLSNIGGNIYNFSGSLELTFTGLTPGAAYGVYLLGLREGAPISQTVSIAGMSTISFTQAAASQELGVNDQIGSDTNLLTSAGKYVRATQSGEIVITVGGSGYFIAGVGLQKL